jgi:hypothetical protein
LATPLWLFPLNRRENPTGFQSEQLFPVSLYVRAKQLESGNALVVAERRYSLDYEIVTRTSNTEQENRVRKVI